MLHCVNHGPALRAGQGVSMIIAVDGPTASGKGTIARGLGARYGLPHLDTGLLYRAVGLNCATRGLDPDNPEEALRACDFDDSFLAEPELRSEASGGLASRVSVHPAVRRALFDRQRAFASQPGGAVLDGRDIGTVIAPEADVKLFVVASVDARAARRHREMLAQGRPLALEDIAADIAARDARDAGRKEAPLVAAADAVLLDTSTIGPEEAIAAAVAIVEAKRAG